MTRCWVARSIEGLHPQIQPVELIQSSSSSRFSSAVRMLFAAFSSTYEVAGAPAAPPKLERLLQRGALEVGIDHARRAEQAEIGDR